MSTRHSLTGEKIDSKICVSSRSAFKIVGPIETPMMITDTDNGQMNFETSSGSDVIRAHDNRVTSPLLYQLCCASKPSEKCVGEPYSHGTCYTCEIM